MVLGCGKRNSLAGELTFEVPRIPLSYMDLELLSVSGETRHQQLRAEVQSSLQMWWIVV